MYDDAMIATIDESASADAAEDALVSPDDGMLAHDVAPAAEESDWVEFDPPSPGSPPPDRGVARRMRLVVGLGSLAASILIHTGVAVAAVLLVTTFRAVQHGYGIRHGDGASEMGLRDAPGAADAARGNSLPASTGPVQSLQPLPPLDAPDEAADPPDSPAQPLALLTPEDAPAPDRSIGPGLVDSPTPHFGRPSMHRQVAAGTSGPAPASAEATSDVHSAAPAAGGAFDRRRRHGPDRPPR